MIDAPMNSTPKMKKISKIAEADNAKAYSKKDVAKMMDEYCTHIMLSVMRREPHVSIADYLNNPLLIK